MIWVAAVIGLFYGDQPFPVYWLQSKRLRRTGLFTKNVTVVTY